MKLKRHLVEDKYYQMLLTLNFFKLCKQWPAADNPWVLFTTSDTEYVFARQTTDIIRQSFFTGYILIPWIIGFWYQLMAFWALRKIPIAFYYNSEALSLGCPLMLYEGAILPASHLRIYSSIASFLHEC